MLRTKQVRRDPTVFVDGHEYLVDFRMRRFRNTGYSYSCPASIDFESPRGQQIWDQCMILECRRCGEVAVELRHMTGVRCEACGEWLCV